MKKYLLAAAVGGAMMLPGAGVAQIGSTIGDPDGYDNRGQCQSALMKMRNQDRPNNSSGYTNKEYNQKTKANFVCQKDPDDGRFYIVQVDDQ